MQCSLCHKQAILQESFSAKQLALEYWRQLKISISFPEEQIGLYHCPNCSYLFFATQGQSTISGDNEFYNTLNKLPWYYFSEKYEYTYAKNFIQPNEKVLEVGCGKAAFAKYIPQTHYIGLEFSTDAKKMAHANGIHIENISIQDYAESHPYQADVVCSFQVLEHVSDPYSFLQAKIKACRGGGDYHDRCAKRRQLHPICSEQYSQYATPSCRTL
ncbi:class I SAM-dependent methyltransferase [Helicobacter pametensis]|uniref:class I SAM-dependent methyltransferase n=1 Tax=Helicobacter pametensis TaxID=95149 RepID=UPI0004BCCD61|nr:methyltransferase domain-containing protein [Helicobacter pametensis]